MPRKNTTSEEEPGARPSRKRTLPVDPYEVPLEEESASPKRRRRQKQAPVSQLEDVKEADAEDEVDADADADAGQSGQSIAVLEATPVKKRRGRPPKSATAGGAADSNKITTPSALRQKRVAQTPVKLNGLDTPGRRNIADRSARRKSARALIDRVLEGALSDDEAEGSGIAREIYESSDDDDDEEEEEEGTQARYWSSSSSTKTLTNTSSGSTPHEQYFYHNKPGHAKTSNNSLSSLDLLTHEEYFSILRQLKDPHAADVQFLQSLHAESFPQWAFELAQGFTTCLYGYGSKRRLLHQFATYLSSSHPQSTTAPPKIVMVNGYVRTTAIREILTTIAAAVDPAQKLVSGNPVAMVQSLLSMLPPSSNEPPVILIINSLDAPPLRKTASQSILAQLAAHPRIRLVCSTDTPDFPLLWDSGLRSAFNFVFHDCTTFAPFGPEIDVVDDVHELLGRMARRVGGKEGVAFVLRSLPENAKSLFRLLVGEVLVVMEDGGGGGSAEGPGIEYRMLYNKAVEEFICSSEMAFRTLLKEFHDHQIIESHKDSIGTEMLSLPFRKDELEAILEELMS
ncbi:origin recognition complex subunit 2-domain-containing protein [Bombardia bombarda]|uniref:Origin recognition complex subunit 2 n=1 Tax=Bombardia bombarda TaxID=252184 RepID=A0AA39XLE4_9PEZI|nr:origin recognition complex subunit 2-domain-containing protein [Bombardia bombarda]